MNRWTGATAATPGRARTILSTLVLLAGCLVASAVAVLASSPQARADTVPPPPSGWTTVFGDNFAGTANSAPSSANWFYDIGTGYGTGETEQTTNSTSNVYLDGNGHLVLKASNNGGTWTSGRIESTRDDFQAPPGGKLEMTASIEQPNPATGLGYWPAFWALGSPMRTGGGWPASGEIDMMEDVNGLNQASQTLHDSAGSSGHALIACPASGSTCQTGYHTYSVIIDRTNTSAESMQFLMDGTVETTITEASVGTAAWQSAIDHGFFIIFDLAMGGNYPNGICNCTTPTSATTSGASMSVAYVAAYEQGGNSTPTATATATGQVTGINGLCLTNQNSLNTEGNPIGVSGCNGSAGQQWSPYTDNTVRVQGGCLDVVSAGTASGTNVDWYACNGTPAQTWTHQANGELVNPNSGLCLTDPGGNTGARLDIETCTGSAQQQWTLPGGGGGTNTVSVTNPGTQTSTAGTAASLQIHATDSANGQTFTYSATGLPAGMTVNPSTGLISGTPTTAGTSTVTVTATDTTNAAGSTTFTWTVNGSGGSCGTTNVALDQPTTASSVESAAYPGVERDRRQHRHPLVQRLLRPAMARGRPGLHQIDLSGHAELGGRLRQGLPDPDLQRQLHLDHDLLHHHRHRRHPDPQRDRQRPLHPHVRHCPRHPVRVLAVGIPGLREQRHADDDRHRRFLYGGEQRRHGADVGRRWRQRRGLDQLLQLA